VRTSKLDDRSSARNWPAKCMDVTALAGCWSRRHVSDWAIPGGDAPYFCTDDGELQDLENKIWKTKTRIFRYPAARGAGKCR